MSVDGTDVSGDYKLAKQVQYPFVNANVSAKSDFAMQLFIGEAETIATVGFKRNGTGRNPRLLLTPVPFSRP